MCINFGLEWLGRTPGARACSEKESAREQRDVALQGKGRVRGVQKERVAKEWPWRARSAGQPKHGEQDHSGTGQPQIPGFQETVGPDPTQPGPLYTGLTHLGVSSSLLLALPWGRRPIVVSKMGQSLAA
jgi:hypothetical protein